MHDENYYKIIGTFMSVLYIFLAIGFSMLVLNIIKHL